MFSAFPRTAWILASALLATPALSSAQTQNAPPPEPTPNETLAQHCVTDAAIARSIAIDRDAGVLLTEETHRLRERLAAAGLPQDHLFHEMAEQTVLARSIYGLYIDKSPQVIYTKYMAFCSRVGTGDAGPNPAAPGSATPGSAAPAPK